MTISSLERRLEALRLREAGLSYAEIGRQWGISKQRANQIVVDKRRPKKAKHSDIMLTPREVARLLGIHVNTVRRWGDRGILTSYRVGPRGDRRFRQSAIEKFLTSQQT